MDLQSLRRQVTKLKAEKAALQVQSKLIEDFGATAPSSCDSLGSTEREMLRATLQKTLDVCAKLTGAEKGSLILVDSKSVVTHSLLTRTSSAPQERASLIGRVLDKGIAGWVCLHRQVGLISDLLFDPGE